MYSKKFCKRQTAIKPDKPLAQTFVTQSGNKFGLACLPGTMQFNLGTGLFHPASTTR